MFDTIFIIVAILIIIFGSAYVKYEFDSEEDRRHWIIAVCFIGIFWPLVIICILFLLPFIFLVYIGMLLGSKFKERNK